MSNQWGEWERWAVNVRLSVKEHVGVGVMMIYLTWTRILRPPLAETHTHTNARVCGQMTVEQEGNTEKHLGWIPHGAPVSQRSPLLCATSRGIWLPWRQVFQLSRHTERNACQRQTQHTLSWDDGAVSTLWPKQVGKGKRCDERIPRTWVGTFIHIHTATSAMSVWTHGITSDSSCQRLITVTTHRELLLRTFSTYQTDDTEISVLYHTKGGPFLLSWLQ